VNLAGNVRALGLARRAELSGKITQLGARAREGLADARPLGDVSLDRGRTDDPARAVLDRRDRDRDGDARTILPQPNGLMILDVLAALHSGPQTLQLSGALGWDDHGEDPSCHFLAAVAIQPLRPGVPGHDPPLEALSDDRIF
jgi:hypothetical protein